MEINEIFSKDKEIFKKNRLVYRKPTINLLFKTLLIAFTQRIPKTRFKARVLRNRASKYPALEDDFVSNEGSRNSRIYT